MKSHGEGALPLDVLKRRGNKLFKEKDYKGLSMLPRGGRDVRFFLGAIRCYSDGLTLFPTDPILLSNRSAAFLAIGHLGDALTDAQHCTRYSDMKWPKGYFRVGNALMEMERWTEAADAYGQGLCIEQTNAELMAKYKTAKQQAQSEKKRLQSQMQMMQRDAAFRLREAKQFDAKEALVRQYKESMTCPDWDLDEYTWRPTFLPSMKMHPAEKSDDEEPYCRVLVSYLRSLTDLNALKECFEILRDKKRLEFYEKEISHAIAMKPGCHVVVVGYWSYVLGLMAAKHGAEKVTCIERCQSMYKLSIATMKTNKEQINELASKLFISPVDVFHCYRESGVGREVDSAAVYLDPADVVVTDLCSHCVFGSGILKKLDHLGEHLAADGCIVIPSAIEVTGYLTDNRVRDVAGFDFSALNKYCWHPHHKRITDAKFRHTQLTEAFKLFRLNLQERQDWSQDNADYSMRDETIQVKATSAGWVSGLLSGFCLYGLSGDGNCLTSWMRLGRQGSTESFAPSFGMAFQYLDGCQIDRGDEIELRLVQDRCLFYIDVPHSLDRPRHAALPDWHFDMLADTSRTEAYRVAIASAIERKQISGTANVHVLDAGAGSGLLSMLAATNGAHLVSAVEFPGHVANLCEENLLLNGLFSKVHVVHKALKNVVVGADDASTDMKSKADVLAMEVFDCGLIGEGVLHMLKHAQENLLHPDAVCVPCGASVFAQPIQLDSIDGMDLDNLKSFRIRSEYESIDVSGDPNRDLRSLADAAKAFSFDFYDVDSCLENDKVDMHFTAQESGVLNGVLFWFELYLDEEHMLSTDPNNVEIGTTWKQALQWVPEHTVEKDDDIHIRATHDTFGFKFQVQLLFCPTSVHCVLET